MLLEFRFSQAVSSVNSQIVTNPCNLLLLELFFRSQVFPGKTPDGEEMGYRLPQLFLNLWLILAQFKTFYAWTLFAPSNRGEFSADRQICNIFPSQHYNTQYFCSLQPFYISNKLTLKTSFSSPRDNCARLCVEARGHCRAILLLSPRYLLLWSLYQF